MEARNGAVQPATDEMPRARAFILLRYTLIAATAYLILAEGGFRVPPSGVIISIALALLSNLVATFLPPRVTGSAVFTVVVVVVDTLWVSLALLSSGRFNAELFYLYFFALLLAAIGENLALIAVGAVVVCGAYVHLLSRGDGAWLWHSRSLIRLPFIFTAAAFYGHLVERTRREQRAAAAAKTAALAKSTFLATIGHEIRTPLNGIIGWTDLLLDSRLDAEQHECADGVRRSGESLLRMLDDILDLSKIEAGLVELEAIPFSLRDVAAEVMELLAADAQQKGVEVCYHVDPAVPENLRGDPGRLRQVLVNLVGNAIKFTAKGDVVLRVRVARASGRGVLLQVEVADTGIGVTPEQRTRLFQAFSRAGGSAARRSDGTGLGLAISKQLVTLMGGEIGVTSEPGSGSTFWFTARVACDAPRDAAATTVAPPGLRTLVVDDNPVARAILEQELRSWGVRTNGAGDGATALARLERGVELEDPYAVAVVDAGMPGTSGADLARAIATEPRLGAITTVLLTTLAQRGPGPVALPANVIATVSKPVDARRLRQAIAEAATRARPTVSAGWSARRSPRATGS